MSEDIKHATEVLKHAQAIISQGTEQLKLQQAQLNKKSETWKFVTSVVIATSAITTAWIGFITCMIKS
jgi:hypothetical protein